MIVIEELQIAEAASCDIWINWMGKALSAVAEGTVIMPKRNHIDFGTNSIMKGL